jgi:hypothetical protein
MTKYGTFLSMIDRHRLHVVCVCGHAKEVNVADLIEHMPRESRLADALARMRCSKCRRRGAVDEVRIYWPVG